MIHTLSGWIVGLSMSMIIGSIITWICWKNLHSFYEKTLKEKKWEYKQEEIEKIPLYPFIVGILERVIFTIMIAFQVSGVGGAIFAWVGIKLVTGWNRLVGGDVSKRMLAFTGLISSLISLFFAILGGLICNGQIPVYLLFR